MSFLDHPIVIATRGSALALAQANTILALCRREFPKLVFELKIIKTTGDKLQTATLSNQYQELPKGLFTKELEEALLNKEADMAVHSLKDVPTELPAGLKLACVTKRADVRDVLIYRDAKKVEAAPPLTEWSPGQKVMRGFKPQLKLRQLPPNTSIGTSSTRRGASARAIRPDLEILPIRGNVPTRLQKLADQPEFDALILAAAGLERLNYRIMPDGSLKGEGIPEGLLATRLETEEMLPCVGQGAVAIETREQDDRTDLVCGKLNHTNTQLCVQAERAFLRAMGGGCASPVGAYAEILGHQLRLRVISFETAVPKVAEGRCVPREAQTLGRDLAERVKGGA